MENLKTIKKTTTYTVAMYDKARVKAEYLGLTFHEYLKHFVTMKVQEFIKALIQHIPDRNFKMIRYYGAYGRRIKKRYSGYLQRSIKQTTFSDFLRKAKKWAPECPFCGAPMKFYSYEKGPPNEIAEVNSKITDWCGVNAQP